MNTIAIDSDVDQAYCRWIAARIFDRAHRDLTTIEGSSYVFDALCFLRGDWAAYLAGELGYSPEAPRRLANRLQGAQ